MCLDRMSIFSIHFSRQVVVDRMDTTSMAPLAAIAPRPFPPRKSHRPWRLSNGRSWPMRIIIQVADTFLDLYSSALIFILFLISFETCCICAVSCGSALFYCYYRYDGHALTANLNWAFFSFAGEQNPNLTSQCTLLLIAITPLMQLATMPYMRSVTRARYE